MTCLNTGETLGELITCDGNCGDLFHVRCIGKIKYGFLRLKMLYFDLDDMKLIVLNFPTVGANLIVVSVVPRQHIGCRNWCCSGFSFGPYILFLIRRIAASTSAFLTLCLRFRRGGRSVCYSRRRVVVYSMHKSE